MKNAEFLKTLDHDRKAAIYAAADDGKIRNFVYHPEYGECRETFSRLFTDVQKGDVDVIVTSGVESLFIETSPGWLDALIQTAKKQEVYIAETSLDLVYDLRDPDDEVQFRKGYDGEEYEKARHAPRPLEAAIAQSRFLSGYIEKDENWFLVTCVDNKKLGQPIYCMSSGAIGESVDMFSLGPMKEILNTLALYGIQEVQGWRSIFPEQEDWIKRIQKQEDAMAKQASSALNSSGKLKFGRKKRRK